LKGRAVDAYRFETSACVDDAFASDIVGLWSEAVGPTFPLRPDVLRACLASSARWVSVVGVRAANDLVGFGYATERNGDVPRLQAVVVSPSHRRRGLGRLIANRLLDACGGRDAVRVEVGAGSGYLWPGVPEDLPDATAFTAALGFVLDLPTYDLRADTSHQSLQALRDGHHALAFGPAEPTDIDGVVRFVEAEFDWEWAADLREFFAAGGRSRDIYLVRDHGDLVGFARLHHPSSHPIGPPLYWADRLTPRAGGLGPIGVSSARRGQGLGTALLAAALVHLRHQGSTDVVIDMTHLLTFYGQFGFVPWLRYRQARLDVGERLR
jgi:GNAT superfamily N-acetyltransferase